MRLCSLPCCGSKHYARSYCIKHYNQFKAYGDPLYRKRNPISFNGESRTIGEWAKVIGIEPSSLSQRLIAGWSVDKALTTPRGKFGPRAQATG